jgi:hypothetical protein
MPSPSPSVKIQIIGGKVYLGNKQTFPPIIWIFTEDEGDGIKSRLSSYIFSTLKHCYE